MMTMFSKRNLPHWIPKGAFVFVTARLKGTLPSEVVESKSLSLNTPSAEKGSSMTYKQDQLFKYYEEILDSENHGPTWLRDPKVAAIWENSLKFFDGKRYELISSTVMSNHVHFIFKDLNHPYGKTMQSLKGFSARESNKYLGRTGAFWQRESFDHWIRNEEELIYYINYILNNPVKAGIVKHWKDFRFNYLNEKYRKYIR